MAARGSAGATGAGTATGSCHMFNLRAAVKILIKLLGPQFVLRFTSERYPTKFTCSTEIRRKSCCCHHQLSGQQAEVICNTQYGIRSQNKG